MQKYDVIQFVCRNFTNLMIEFLLKDTYGLLKSNKNLSNIFKYNIDKFIYHNHLYELSSEKKTQIKFDQIYNLHYSKYRMDNEDLKFKIIF